MNSYDKVLTWFFIVSITSFVLFVFTIVREFIRLNKKDKTLISEFKEITSSMKSDLTDEEKKIIKSKVTNFCKKATEQGRLALALQLTEFYITKN